MTGSAAPPSVAARTRRISSPRSPGPGPDAAAYAVDEVLVPEEQWFRRRREDDGIHVIEHVIRLGSESGIRIARPGLGQSVRVGVDRGDRNAGHAAEDASVSDPQ